MASKYVYEFHEGNKEMRNLLGGKGANLAEMTSIGLPVPPGFTITTEVCNIYSGTQALPRRVCEEQVDAALAKVEELTGKRFGDAKDPAAHVGALRRARQHAGHDGHDPQPGSQRHHRPGPDREHRQPALRLRLLPALRRACTATSCWAASPSDKDEIDPFEEVLEQTKKAKGVQLRHRARRRRPQGPGGDVQGEGARAHRPQLPRGPARAALGRHHAPCSARGTTTAPSPIAGCTTSPTPGARRSTCRRWSTATWATTRAPASPSRATRRPARTSSTASFSSTRRARTWSPACARRVP